MGGTRVNARGIDEDGNSANCVETEQLVFNHIFKENKHLIITSSYVQLRGSIPVFWQ